MAATVRLGTCSFADEGLVKSWYPRGVSTSKARLAYYSERFDTGRQYDLATRMMKIKGWTREEARKDQISGIPAGRYGQPSLACIECLRDGGAQYGRSLHR